MRTNKKKVKKLFKFEELDREIGCCCLRENCLLITFETGQVELYKLQNSQKDPSTATDSSNIPNKKFPNSNLGEKIVPCFLKTLKSETICSKIGSYECYSYATCCDMFFTKDDIMPVVGTKSGDIYVFSVRDNCLFRVLRRAHKAKINERRVKCSENSGSKFDTSTLAYSVHQQCTTVVISDL